MSENDHWYNDDIRLGITIAEESAGAETGTALLRFILENRLIPWQWGDGNGGAIHEAIDRIAKELGLWVPSPQSTKKKRTISSALRTAVFERDSYRCQNCGDHKDLTIDHVHPESKGGSSEMENLQTLCRSCNSQKGTRI